MKKKAVFNWSGGKDSALALYKALQSNEYEIISLLTTVGRDNSCSSMHLIPSDFLEAQADSIGIPLYQALLPSKGLEGYEEEMRNAVEYFKAQGVTHFIFGDIFLHDVKAYREKQLQPYAIEVVEPLWNKTSEEIIEEFLASGIKTKIVITQADKLDERYVGRELDSDFIKSLPEDIDPCGENGEYHTFVYDGPIFKKKIDFSLDTPKKLSYNIKMDDGNTQTFHYWQAKIEHPKS